uniref:PEG1/MEST protein n=1 Tax=Homo sapiens TaxID=9606 RepID=Q9UE26_HUMAN|nr:PEG1/MEST [Homo sapiens]
MVRRDRLRR